jgi:hypothetical protein
MTHESQVLERIDVVIHPQVRLSSWSTPSACGPTGAANFPDPSTGPSVKSGFDPNGLGIDSNSPTFQPAHPACHGIVSGSK